MLNEDQKKAFAIMQAGLNIFLTGDAGTGKSFLAKTFIDYCKANGKNVMVTAPTGIAALNVGGITIHRAFLVPTTPIGPRTPVKVTEVLKAADVIIIDEISMVRFDIFSYIVRAIKKAQNIAKKKIQLIVVGDFFQLPPVMPVLQHKILEQLWNREILEGYAFESLAWTHMHFESIILHTVIRQSDPVFINTLNKIRIGEKQALDKLTTASSALWQDEAIYLCSNNRDVDNFNIQNLAKLKSKEICYKAAVYGKVAENDKAVEDMIILKKGARVMTVVNAADNLYQNGSMGYIQEFTNDGVIVQFDNSNMPVLVTPYSWKIEEYVVENGVLGKNTIGIYTQIPLKLAYAISIHKSQGKTFESVNLNPYCFCEGQLYVALSRVRSCQGLYIKNNFINPQWLKTSAKVLAFYQSLTSKKRNKKMDMEEIL